MSISERRNHIIEQINAIEDEDTLSILEEAISHYATSSQKDVTDDLTEEQFRELKAIAEEPFEKDTISEDEFNKKYSRWRTKYPTGNQNDITDGLTDEQFRELKAIIEEPSDKDIITKEEFNETFARWRTK